MSYDYNKGLPSNEIYDFDCDVNAVINTKRRGYHRWKKERAEERKEKLKEHIQKMMDENMLRVKLMNENLKKIYEIMGLPKR